LLTHFLGNAYIDPWAFFIDFFFYDFCNIIFC
jgi:hypothetical protein